MDLTYNEYLGVYQSADGTLVYDPSSGAVYQFTGAGFVQIGVATPTTPQQPWPQQPWPQQPWPQQPWPQQPWPQRPWPGRAGAPTQPPTPAPVPGSSGAARPPVFVVPPKSGSIVPSPATQGGTFVPYKTTAPAATAPAPGTPTVKQGAPPPRSGTAPRYIPPGNPTNSGGGGSITGPKAPDETSGYWEILLDTDGTWAGNPLEHKFARTGLKMLKVRYPGGRLWEYRGNVVMKEKDPAPGSMPMYTILYDNPSPRADLSYWENMQAVQVQPVPPF